MLTIVITLYQAPTCIRVQPWEVHQPLDLYTGERGKQAYSVTCLTCVSARQRLSQDWNSHRLACKTNTSATVQAHLESNTSLRFLFKGSQRWNFKRKQRGYHCFMLFLLQNTQTTLFLKFKKFLLGKTQMFISHE